jgi:hypothetical protein
MFIASDDILCVATSPLFRQSLVDGGGPVHRRAIIGAGWKDAAASADFRRDWRISAPACAIGLTLHPPARQ